MIKGDITDMKKYIIITGGYYLVTIPGTVHELKGQEGDTYIIRPPASHYDDSHNERWKIDKRYAKIINLNALEKLIYGI